MTGETRIRPNTVEPCRCEPSRDLVTVISDGLTDEYRCVECGVLLADLTWGPEP